MVTIILIVEGNENNAVKIINNKINLQSAGYKYRIKQKPHKHLEIQGCEV